MFFFLSLIFTVKLSSVPKDLDQGVRSIFIEISCSWCHLLIHFSYIVLIFAKFLYIFSFQIAFPLPLSSKVWVFNKSFVKNLYKKKTDLKHTLTRNYYFWYKDILEAPRFRTELAFCIWLETPKLSFPWHICKRQHLKNKLSLQAIEIKHSDLIQSTVQLVPWDEDSWIFSNGKMKSDQACLLSFTKYNYVNYKAPL